MRLWRRLELLLAAAFVMACVNQGQAASVLYGSSDLVDLFTIDLATGHGTRVGSLPASATEIEFDTLTGRAYLQYINGAFQIQQFNINTAAGIGAPVNDGGSFTGLEFVGPTLYGTVITASQGPSTLRILNPTTGVSSVIGPTGVGPISGLAYNESTAVMYGIAGGPGPASLYMVNLSTGAATLVGSSGIQAGSLEFGPDGILYAGGTGPNGGNLYRINPSTGLATLVGPTGFGAVTGLTLANPVPEPSSIWLMSLSILSFACVAAYKGIRKRGR
jgi:hypothetical protein